ncbi:hypothetical protein [Romboutsia lituseburensis]|uniref:hypothetical protein n=1 Tax=Romboutsia lituseburensis TaxID=1537 RepID=UPI0022EA44FA|nr:hypothetical protein [Romboutsia lituseburensis]
MVNSDVGSMDVDSDKLKRYDLQNHLGEMFFKFGLTREVLLVSQKLDELILKEQIDLLNK